MQYGPKTIHVVGYASVVPTKEMIENPMKFLGFVKEVSEESIAASRIRENVMKNERRIEQSSIANKYFALYKEKRAAAYYRQYVQHLKLAA